MRWEGNGGFWIKVWHELINVLTGPQRVTGYRQRWWPSMSSFHKQAWRSTQQVAESLSSPLESDFLLYRSWILCKKLDNPEATMLWVSPMQPCGKAKNEGTQPTASTKAPYKWPNFLNKISDSPWSLELYQLGPHTCWSRHKSLPLGPVHISNLGTLNK